MRKGDDLGVELVDREVFADEDYFLYAVFAERGVAEIEKTGKASFQKRAVGFFYVDRAGKSQNLPGIVFRWEIVEIGHGFISCIMERVYKGNRTPNIIISISQSRQIVNSRWKHFARAAKQKS